MLNGLYSSATALNVNLHNQDLISHNLAHINVPGFKRVTQSVSTFADKLEAYNILNSSRGEESASNGSGSTTNINGVQFADYSVDFSQGRLEKTGDQLNVAIDGKGFFVVQGESGPLYTRNGNFKLNQAGQLSLVGGQIVEGDAGPIEIPNALSTTIGSDGTVSSDGQVVGRIRMVDFDNLLKLTPAGTTLFSAADDARPIPLEPTEMTLKSGFLESSNTQAVNELIKMIAGMRHFEAAQKTLTTISEAIAKHTSTQTA